MKLYNLIFLIALASCSSPNKVSNGDDLSEQNSAIEVDSRADTVHDQQEVFDTFFKKFNADSTFQHSRIQFPVILKTVDGEGVTQSSTIGKSSWKFTQLSSSNNLKAQIDKNKITEDRVNVKYSIEDTGVRVDHLFIRKNNKWWLTEISDYSN